MSTSLWFNSLDANIIFIYMKRSDIWLYHFNLGTNDQPMSLLIMLCNNFASFEIINVFQGVTRIFAKPT